jgi:phosphoglycolate phosphatase-like HAD superfamily hydrolase
MIKTILWDFDGVILDSMKIRDWGFEEIFKDYDQELINQLIVFHNENGGLSRYVKIRYFFEEILRKPIKNDEVLDYAKKFSILMRRELINPKNLILDSVKFIKNNYQNYNFDIVSGSDQEELRFLCQQLKINKYFNSINGSPTPKNILVKNVINSNDYLLSETCLIGDSINDYEAAKENGILFLAYNNSKLNSLSDLPSFY